MDATTRDQALEAMANALATNNSELNGRESEVLEALQSREDQGSTGQHGVAIPHVKLEGLEAVQMVVAVSPTGIDFNALDGELVNVMFGVVRPAEATEDHLDILRWLAGVAGHQDFVSFACQAKNQQEFVDLLSELTVA